MSVPPILHTMARLLPLVAAAAAAAGASAFPFCGTVMNDSTGVYTWARVDNATGAITNLFALPTLDGYGGGITAGAELGKYYTVSGNVTQQAQLFVVSVSAGTAAFVTVQLPPEYAFLSLYGVAAVETNGVPGQALVQILGFAPGGERYCFLAVVDDASGAVVRVVANLTAAYRQWVYLYAGVTALSADGSLFFLAAVEGAHDYTTLFGFNLSTPEGAAGTPFITVPYTGLGDFMALRFSPALAARHGGGTGLLALVDDDENTAAGLWLLAADGQSWDALYQYAPNTLESSGFMDMELSPDGLTAFSLFYDDHTPVANQIVSTVDLAAAPPAEVARTLVQGSQMGTAIADLALCPPPSEEAA
jgi:hypothetical protein